VVVGNDQIAAFLDEVHVLLQALRPGGRTFQSLHLQEGDVRQIDGARSGKQRILNVEAVD
jgi:hypothetical protein